MKKVPIKMAQFMAVVSLLFGFMIIGAEGPYPQIIITVAVGIVIVFCSILALTRMIGIEQDIERENKWINR